MEASKMISNLKERSMNFDHLIVLAWLNKKNLDECSEVMLSKLFYPNQQGGVMVKVLDCGIVVCEFELQSRYYVHFRTNTLGKGMYPLILPEMG